MSKIYFISPDISSLNSFGRELQENLNCELYHSSDLNKILDDLEDYSSYLFIVDLPSFDYSEETYLSGFRRLYPGSHVIALVRENQLPGDDVLLRWGIDEIVVRPRNETQRAHFKKGLLKKISILANVGELQEKLQKKMCESQIIAKSKALQDIILRLSHLANSSSTVLITGETGTGKELIARAIHYLGPRSGGPFVTVDCSSIPEHLAENELFGHVRGAYTDAGPTTRGMIHEADSGTLFLDEIEALPIAIQSKFLRFLQERHFKPLGYAGYHSVDVRVVAATNVDLAQAVKQKTFRKDLFYRLNVIPIFIPPLRQRKEDIPALIRFFIQKYSADRQDLSEIPKEIFQKWLNHSWPGNARELENKIQEWLLLRKIDSSLSHYNFDADTPVTIQPLSEIRKETLANCEIQYLNRLMTYTRGNISQAALLARLNRKSLGILLKKHQIDANHFRF